VNKGIGTNLRRGLRRLGNVGGRYSGRRKRAVGKSDALAYGEKTLKKASTQIPEKIGALVRTWRRGRKPLSSVRIMGEQVRRGRYGEAFRNLLGGKRTISGARGMAGTRGKELMSRIQFGRLVDFVARKRGISRGRAAALLRPSGQSYRSVEAAIAPRVQSATHPIAMGRNIARSKLARAGALGVGGYGAYSYLRDRQNTKKSAGVLHRGIAAKYILTKRR